MNLKHGLQQTILQETRNNLLDSESMRAACLIQAALFLLKSFTLRYFNDTIHVGTTS